MKGHSSIIDHLNALLAGELTAIDQYFAHSRMYRQWGLQQLFQRIDHEMHEEQAHADVLIKRILFLEGTPDLASRTPLRIGRDVRQMLRNDLDLELEVVGQLRQVIAHCEAAQDFETRAQLLVLLKDTEEDHAHWLEIQIGLIERLGLRNYLQSQL